MSFVNILLALFNLVPKKYKDAALKALSVTNWLKSAIVGLQQTGVLDRTNVDENILKWLDKITDKFGVNGMSFEDYLRNVKPESFKGDLGQIGALITEELHGKSNTSTAKAFFEIMYSKQKSA